MGDLEQQDGDVGDDLRYTKSSWVVQGELSVLGQDRATRKRIGNFRHSEKSVKEKSQE